MLSMSASGGGEAGRVGICAKRKEEVVLETVEAGGSVIWPSYRQDLSDLRS